MSRNLADDVALDAKSTPETTNHPSSPPLPVAVVQPLSRLAGPRTARALAALTILVSGAFFFKRIERTFADVV